MPTWDPTLYLQFAGERTQPSVDLIARINGAREPARIIDLGCGPGNSTAMLRQRWPQADIIGLDSSAEMIAAASQAYPSEKWLLADAASWTAETPFDLVFANASLQWVPRHQGLFPHLMAQLAPGGILAVQMPSHFESPLHQVMLEIADDDLWRERMVGPRNALTNESASFYYDVLQPLAASLDIWQTEYFHRVDGAQAVVEWFRGTGMRPFLEALESEEQKRLFEHRVLDGYRRAYPIQKDGRLLFPFRRLFIVARK